MTVTPGELSHARCRSQDYRSSSREHQLTLSGGRGACLRMLGWPEPHRTAGVPVKAVSEPRPGGCTSCCGKRPVAADFREGASWSRSRSTATKRTPDRAMRGEDSMRIARRQITSADVMRGSCWAEHVPPCPARNIATSKRPTALITMCGRSSSSMPGRSRQGCPRWQRADPAMRELCYAGLSARAGAAKIPLEQRRGRFVPLRERCSDWTRRGGPGSGISVRAPCGRHSQSALRTKPRFGGR